MNRIADRTCNVIASLMGGAHLDRVAISKALGVQLAAADRYMRSISVVPGVTLYKEPSDRGRARPGPARLLVAFSFSNALRKARGL